MTRERPALRRTVAQLRSLVDELRRSGIDTLPPVAELANRFGVSRTTVTRAVASLSDEGLVHARRGSGVRLVSPSTPPPPPRLLPDRGPPLLARWEQVRAQIAADFLVRPGRRDTVLPTGSELARRYTASHRTIRRALQSLVEQGRLIPQGERFVVQAVTPVGLRKSIVLVQLATSAGLPARRFPNEDQNLALFERECGERGIGVHTYLLSSGRSELLPFSPHVPRAVADLGESVLGVVAWLPGNAGSGVDMVLRSIKLRNRPVAVGARQAFLERMLHRPEPGPLRGFCTPDYGFDAGIAVGQHLYAHGHRRVVCLCPASGPRPEEPERTSGIRAVLERGGESGRVELLGYRHSSESRVPSANAAVDGNAFAELAARLEKSGTLDELERLIMRAVSEAGIPLRQRIRQHLLQDDIRRAFLRYTVPQDVTALVAFNDNAALVCLDLLRERHVRVPEGISLASFDDTPQASLASITSYNFNESQVLLSMLDWVLWPQDRARARIVAPPRGFVSERGSVALVRPTTP